MARAGQSLATLVRPTSNHALDYSGTLPGRTCTGNFALVEGSARSILERKPNTSPEDGLLTGKLVHLALPVRWSLVGEKRGAIETACTYDIHPRGARLVSGRDLNLGDLVMIERGRS